MISCGMDPERERLAHIDQDAAHRTPPRPLPQADENHPLCWCGGNLKHRGPHRKTANEDNIRRRERIREARHVAAECRRIVEAGRRPLAIEELTGIVEALQRRVTSIESIVPQLIREGVK